MPKDTIMFLAIGFLLSIIAIFIRVFPYLDYSIYQGHFQPFFAFPTVYTIDSGHLLYEGAMQRQLFTFPSFIYTISHLKGFNALHTILFLIIGVTDTQDVKSISNFFLFPGTLLFPLVVILITNRLAKTQSEKLSTVEYVLIYLVALFPSFTLIFAFRGLFSMSAYGFSLLMMSVYCLLGRRDRKFSLLGMVFGMLLLLFYHTAATVYLILLTSIFAIQLLKRKTIVSNLFVALYVSSFSAYNIYVEQGKFLDLLVRLFNAEKVITLAEYSYLNAPFWWMTLVFLNGFLVSLPVFLFILMKVRKKIQHVSSDLLTYLIAGLGFVGVSFFIWRGLRGLLTRTGEYGTLLSLMTLSILLVSTNGKKKSFIKIIALLIIITSIVPYLTNVYNYPSYLKKAEWSSIEWYSYYGSRDQYVFTDFRLGTPPVFLDLFNFVGVYGDNPAHEETFLAIYYENDPFKAKMELTKFGAKYLLLSREMMSDYPGIVGGYQFDPIPTSSMYKYDYSEYFEKIYDDGMAVFYAQR